MFQCSFVLQFCFCMDLIAATRAEGGLVFLEPEAVSNKYVLSQRPMIGRGNMILCSDWL